jgi:DivIVA domain-containing protein
VALAIPDSEPGSAHQRTSGELVRDTIFSQRWEERVVWILWLVVITALVLGVVMLALGRGDGLVDEAPDDVVVRMPEDRALVASDVETLRLPLALRGYQMAAVDEVLDRLAAELEIRDAEIRKLKSRRTHQTAVDSSSVDSSPADTTRAPDA